MKTKTFLFYSIFYIGVVGILVFSQYGGSYTLKVTDLSLTLPVAVWFIIPICIFAFLCIFHVMYNGIGVYRDKKALEKDKIIYNEVAKDVLLGIKPEEKHYKTDSFKIANDITKFLSPWYDTDKSEYIKLDNEELRSIIATIQEVKSGKFMDLKKYKLSKDNPIFIKNEFNKLESDEKYALEILKNKSNFSQELYEKAYKIALNTLPYAEIKKYEIPTKKEDIDLVICRYIKDENYEISPDEIYALLSDKNFSEKDYLKFAKDLEQKMPPEFLIANFDKLRAENSEALNAYFYLLYEFGMMDELKEQLKINEVDENNKFSILLFLKENGKNISINSII